MDLIHLQRQFIQKAQRAHFKSKFRIRFELVHFYLIRNLAGVLFSAELIVFLESMVSGHRFEVADVLASCLSS